MKRVFAIVAIVTSLAVSAAAQSVRVNCCDCVNGHEASYDLSTGHGTTTDTLWTVNWSAATIATSVNGNWTAAMPGGWIKPATSSGLNAVYRYQAFFTIPTCTVPMAVRLDGKFAADDSAVLYLDAQQIASCPASCFGNTSGVPMSFSVPSIAPGSHTLHLDVTDSSGSITGASLQATLRTKCRDCEPCPIIGSYDGANCQIGQAPSGSTAFIYHNAFYYTPVNGTCPMTASWFDGANCYVMPVPPGTNPFIWLQTWWYVERRCKPVAGPADSHRNGVQPVK